VEKGPWASFGRTGPWRDARAPWSAERAAGQGGKSFLLEALTLRHPGTDYFPSLEETEAVEGPCETFSTALIARGVGGCRFTRPLQANGVDADSHCLFGARLAGIAGGQGVIGRVPVWF